MRMSEHPVADSTADAASVPQAVSERLELAKSELQGAFGIELDFGDASLALVDCYLATRLAEATSERRPALLEAMGCYFGEVARRLLAGRWRVFGDSPLLWRIELSACYLYFHPIGMAGEVLLGCESDRYDGSFATLDELRAPLEERLSMAPPLSESAYYSLSGRMETLQLVADWLVARQLLSSEGPRRYGPKEYDAIGSESPEAVSADPEDHGSP